MRMMYDEFRDAGVCVASERPTQAGEGEVHAAHACLTRLL